MGLQRWCLLCALEKWETLAMGASEDGDPACGKHGGDFEPFPKAAPLEHVNPLATAVLRKGHEVVVSQQKMCTVEGCGKAIRSDNTAGVCKKHRHVKNNALRAAKPKEPKTLRQVAITAAPAEVARIDVQAKAQFLPLMVSEAFLDELWTRMTPEQKIRQFIQWTRQESRFRSQ
jgi:hypothetical protein